jgi:cytochrome c553
MVRSLDRRPTLRRLLAITLSAASCLPALVSFAAERTGQQIYVETCAKCHGKSGEGVEDKYPDPLIGDKSLLELAKVIEKTMPEDKPGTCTGEEASKVAAYIHDAFYSPVAQDRNRPARVELSRLTVRQYQNAVADLVGSFRPAPAQDARQGLTAEYYKNRRFRPEDRVLERTDSQVDFDFGTASPAPGQTEDYEFSIRWEGALLAPDTGDYELVIRTEHAARLWINDLDRPLIDAWVKSGNDTEYRATIRLIGGRQYPIQLEFSKAKQGVDDSKKQKEKPKSLPATVRLCWKLPQRAEEPIPARCLSPRRVSEVVVVRTPFPPDDRSIGYERGTSVSKEWDAATTDAAFEVATYVSEHVVPLAGIRQPPKYDPGSPSGRTFRRRRTDENEVYDTAEERTEKLLAFAVQFAERAFRRPLTDEQKLLFIDGQFAQAADPETAVKHVVLLTLKSPRFLFREVVGDAADPYNVAARLSFGLWDSLPDEELLKAAAAGELSRREQIAKQAERMLADARTRGKLREFFVQWLRIDQAPEMAKDPARFPEFNAATASDLRTSLELFVEDVVWSEKSDFRELLKADWLYLNGRLAQLYRPDLPPDAPFIKMETLPGERAGVLTHPYMMAGFAYTATSSPIHRGVFVARSVLGRSLRPPPEAVSPLPVELHANLTTRERIALQTKGEACQTCHSMINPLGFTLENFDAVGRFRGEEAGKSIDTSGGYRTRNGEWVKFGGVRDLASFLADSEETRSAFVEQLFQYLIKQPIRAYGSAALPDLRNSFAANGFNIRKLAADIVTTAALVPAAEKNENP